ncbi:unnamed protein product [Prunus brigantina]
MGASPLPLLARVIIITMNPWLEIGNGRGCSNTFCNDPKPSPKVLGQVDIWIRRLCLILKYSGFPYHIAKVGFKAVSMIMSIGALGGHYSVPLTPVISLFFLQRLEQLFSSWKI